jgi:hypothetical protein
MHRFSRGLCSPTRASGATLKRGIVSPAAAPVPGSYEELVWNFYHPKVDWNGQVWTPGVYPCKSFPQIAAKADFGIAVSGGGLRAAALGLGWLRGLNSDGLVTHARYISVNSGGSWITEPLLWAAVLNGNSKVNSSMTMAEVDAVYRKEIAEAARDKLPGALTVNFGGEVVSNLVKNIGTKLTKTVWSPAVEKLFKAAVGESYEKFNDYLSVKDGNAASSRLPFLIVNSSIVGVDGDGNDGAVSVAPFEFTPTYCGAPVDPTTINPKSFATRGGFVHRSVFSRDYSSEDKAVTADTATGSVVVRTADAIVKSTDTVKLSEISSVSSSAVVEGFYEKYKYEILAELGQTILDGNFRMQKHYWAYNEAAGNNLMGGQVTFADGGAADNTAILALLRRGVKNIVALCAVKEDIQQAPRESDGNYNMRILNGLYDYMGLFGAVTKKPENITYFEAYNKQRAVFKEEKWSELLQAICSLRAQGKPLVHTLRNLEVHANPLCGVPAGTVNITFVFNGVSTEYKGKEFWNALKARDFRNARASVNLGGLFEPYPVAKDFPLIATDVLQYSRELVDELAGIAEWSIKKGEVADQLDVSAFKK